MDRNEIMNSLKGLARVNLYYDDLFNDLEYLYHNNYEEFDDIMTNLEEQKFTDIIDLIIYLEW